MMKTFLPRLYAGLWLLAISSFAWAEETPSTVAVEKKDLKVFLDLAKQEKCRNETAPTIASSPVVIVRDQLGRVYAKTEGHKVTVDWCNYHLESVGTLKVSDYVAPSPPPSLWSPKLKLVAGLDFRSLYTAGVRESAYVGLSGQLITYKSFYPYLTVGNLGFGGGFGYYLTPTLGADVGYMYTWDSRHTPFMGVSLALW